MKLYVGIPTMGSVVDSQTHALRDIEKKWAGKVEFVYPTLLVRRMFHDYARNEIVKDFLASDCDVLWFLDSDVTPNPNVLDKLVERYDEWEAAGAPYPVFMTPAESDMPEVVFTVYRQVEGKLTHSEVPVEGVDLVDGVATGCMFLKRSVLETMEQPYFEFKYDETSRRMTEGEDLGFCRKLVERGVKFLIDFSAVCKHQKSVDLLDINNYARMYANRAVIAYDAQIKEQVAAAIKAAYKTGIEVGQRERSSLILPNR